MDKQPVGQLPDLTQSNNDDEIMVITNDEYNQLKKEKIADFITDLTSTDENNAIVKGTDGKLFTKDFGNASNITEGTLPVSVLPDIPKDKLPEIETDDLPDSGITAGTYTYPTDIVVNSKGQVTSITEGQAGANNANQDLSNLGPLGLDKLNQSKALETGSVSSDADVYADILERAHSTFDLSKFTVVGSPTITDDGIASGFTHSNYVFFSLSLNNTQKIVHYSKYVFKNASRAQVLWSFYTTRLELTTTTVSFKWSNTNIFSGNFKNTLQDDNIIEIFFILNDNGQNKLIAKVNGEESVNITNSTSLAEYSLASIRIGDYTQIDNLYFTGSIDLKSFAFWADGVPVFNGNKTGLYIAKPDNYKVVGSPTITEDGVASGFSNNNYPYITLPKSGNNIKLMISGVYGSNGNILGFYEGSNSLDLGSTYVRSYINGKTLITNIGGTFNIGDYYKIEAVWSNGKQSQTVTTKYGTYTTTSSYPFAFPTNLQLNIGAGNKGLYGITAGSIDLNSIKVCSNGNLVYQPCLKIPYTETFQHPNVVDVAYRDRVQDLYEQTGEALFYTIDEENENFTLPMGDIYGMIEKKNEELNNPFSLFDSKYSETPVYNLSWLLSDGTYYSKSVYVTAYEALVVENNSEIEAGTSVTLPSGGNYVKRGLSVKLSTADDITDYDFVINTTDETFRLPLKTKLASGNQVMGTGIALGLTNGTANYGLRNALVGNTWGYLGADSKSYGTPVGEVHAGGGSSNQDITLGITSEANKSGMMLSDNNLYLYFYVGETTQSPYIINYSQKLNNDASNLTEPGKRNIKNLVYPDFNNTVSLPITLNLVQQADKDCYLNVNARSGSDLWVDICDADGVTKLPLISSDTVANVATIQTSPLIPAGTYFKVSRNVGTENVFTKIYTTGESNV